MEFKELIKERRSVRAYQADKTIPNEVIGEILEETIMAPSWKNSETARYYVANTPEMIEKIRATLPEFNQKSAANASLVVTTYVKNIAGFTADAADNELGNKWGAYDLGLSNAYFVLAAKEHGLDTLIMGLRDANAIREILNIPKNEQIAAVIALGYADGEPKFRPRKDITEIAKLV